MFLICLLLIALVTIAIVTDTEPSTAEQAEFIPIRCSGELDQKSKILAIALLTEQINLLSLVESINERLGRGEAEAIAIERLLSYPK